MKRDITVILLCFVAAAGGANVQPILTGAGKLVFPENATSAYLQASSGHLTLAAGATNGNIILTPSGTGQVGIGTTSPGIQPLAGRRYLTIKGSTLAGAVEYATGAADADGAVVGVEQWTDVNSVAADKRVAGIFGDLEGATANNRGGRLRFFTKANGGGGPVERARLDSNGNFGFGGNAAPAYAVDATGDVNASGVYRKGTTAGVGTGGNVTVCTSGACASSCTLQFTGGIRTGGTCPI